MNYSDFFLTGKPDIHNSQFKTVTGKLLSTEGKQMIRGLDL